MKQPIYNFSFRCMTCSKDCGHDYQLTILKKDGGYWLAQGKYPTLENALEVFNKTKEVLEKRANSTKQA